MKARIIITSVGLGGFGSFGVNLGTAAYLQIGERIVQRNYGIADLLSLGSGSSTLAVGHLKTGYFYLGEDVYKKLMSLDYLAGKSMQLELKGTLVARGTVDVKIMLIDEAGRGEVLLELFDVPAEGAQVESTQVRGRIRMVPSRLYTLDEVAAR